MRINLNDAEDVLVIIVNLQVLNNFTRLKGYQLFHLLREKRCIFPLPCFPVTIFIRNNRYFKFIFRKFSVRGSHILISKSIINVLTLCAPNHGIVTGKQ